jgi:hypothetical protein
MCHQKSEPPLKSISLTKHLPCRGKLYMTVVFFIGPVENLPARKWISHKRLDIKLK